VQLKLTQILNVADRSLSLLVMKTRSKLTILSGAIGALLSVTPAFAATPASPSQQSPETIENKPSDTTRLERWSDRIFDEFQEMQQRMDRIFHDATSELREHTDFLDTTGFSSSVKLSDEQNHYVIRVSLPDRDVNSVTANLEANNTLRITAKEERKEQTTSSTKEGDKRAAGATYLLGRYEQLLSLPGPVDASKMKIDRSGNTVTITLPKADISKS
jgi:HSP20 family molecular chaperone IbpA